LQQQQQQQQGASWSRDIGDLARDWSPAGQWAWPARRQRAPTITDDGRF